MQTALVHAFVNHWESSQAASSLMTVLTSVEGPLAQEAAASAETSPRLHATKQVSVGRSVVRGALALVAMQPLTWAVTLLGTILGPRILGSHTLGELAVALTINTIVSTVTGLGISELLVRRIAQQPHTIRRDQGIALVVQIFVACIGFLAVSVFGWMFARSIVDFPLLVVACLVMLVAPAQTVLLSSFRGAEQHRNYAWFCTATTVASSLTSLLVLIATGKVIVAVAAGATAFAATTMLSWKLSGLRPTFPALKRSLFANSIEFIHGGAPFLGWQVTQLAYSQIDRLILGILVPASQVGWYAAANTIIAIPIFIPTAIVTPLFPALSRNAHVPHLLRRTIADTVRFTLLLTVPLSAGTISMASVIPSFLGWPADFSNSALPMSILALQLPLVSVGMVVGSVLMAIGRERRMVVIATVATIFNIAANFVAIPIFSTVLGNGGVGAALVTVVSEVLMLVGSLSFIPKQLLDARSIWVGIRIFIAGAATAIVATALLPVAVPLSIFAGAVTYFVGAALLRVLTIQDVRLAADLLGTRLRRR